MLTSTFCILAGSHLMTWRGTRPWDGETEDGQNVYFDPTEAQLAAGHKRTGLEAGGYTQNLFVDVRPYAPAWADADEGGY